MKEQAVLYNFYTYICHGLTIVIMENKTTLLQYTMTNGLMLGIIMIILSVLLYILGIIPDKLGKIIALSLVNYAVIIVFLVIVMKNYRNKILGGNISFNTAFLVGLLTIVFGGILSGFYGLVFNTVIDPAYMDRVYEGLLNWMYDMYSNMGLSDSQIDDIVSRYQRQWDNYTPVRTFFSGLLSNVVAGTVISLIVSAFIKKNPPPPGLGEQL